MSEPSGPRPARPQDQQTHVDALRSREQQVLSGAAAQLADLVGGLPSVKYLAEQAEALKVAASGFTRRPGQTEKRLKAEMLEELKGVISERAQRIDDQAEYIFVPQDVPQDTPPMSLLGRVQRFFQGRF